MTATGQPQGVKAPAGVRPSVDDVALLIRARTKDSSGNEVGTFDDDTRPTETQVESQIDKSVALILIRLPPVEQLPPELVPAISAVVALEAACKIEKSYYPEQVRTDRSAHAQLYAEFLADLEALVLKAEQTVAGVYGASKIGMIPVESWTMMPQTSIVWSP
jgi:hypothetical protein